MLGKPDDMPKFTSEGKFDITPCSHVLEHVDEDDTLVRKFAGALKENGRLVVNLPINEVWRDPNHVGDYTPESARRLLETCGFSIDNIRMEDGLTAFILSHEKSNRSSSGKRLLLRALRLSLALALAPINLVVKLDELLGQRYKCQQLILVARLQTATNQSCADRHDLEV